MEEKKRIHNFVKVDAYILREDDLEAFYPLMPEEHRKADIEGEFAILGAVGTDAEEICHACGVMILKVVRDDMLLIRWMLVAPQHQNQGIGYALMDLAQSIGREMNMQLVGNFSQKAKLGKDGSVYSFMKHNDFAIYAEGARSYTVSLGEIGKEAFFQRSTKGSDVMTLEETPSRMIMVLNHRLAEKGLLLIGPISKEDVLADISLVVERDKRIQSCIIFRKINEEEIELAFVYTDSKGSVQLPLLLLHAYQLLKEKYDSDTKLVIPCVTEASCKLVETLIPSARILLESYSVQWLPGKVLE